MPAPRKYPDEMRERAVRMVREKMTETPRLSQNRACIEVGEQLGIKGDTLRNWVKVVRVDDGELPGTTSADAKRIAVNRPGDQWCDSSSSSWGWVWPA